MLLELKAKDSRWVEQSFLQSTMQSMLQRRRGLPGT